MNSGREQWPSAVDIQWIIEYEECDLDGLWVYKLDHEPIADGCWHALQRGATARYRLADKTFQFASPDERTPPDDFETALRAFATAGRLAPEGVIEVYFQKRQTGYELYSKWLLHHAGVMIPELRAESLRQAYRDLKVLERLADEEE